MNGCWIQAVGADIVATDGFRTAIPFWGFIMLCGGVVYSIQLLIWTTLKCGQSSELETTSASTQATDAEKLESERERLIP